VASKGTQASADDIEAFLAALEHPQKDAILAVREVFLRADSAISDGVKWNAPSFRTSEWFATIHHRAKEGVQVILHFGARAREGDARAAIDDPYALLEWLGPDRASVRFRDASDVQARAASFADVVRQWIRHLAHSTLPAA
jgi:hypothetical protein